MFFSKKMLALLGLASCLSLAPLSAIQASASKYPQKPISLVIAFPAGTTSDSIGRIFASELSNALGQSVVVENKPGGNATIGAKYVVNAKPDGHTIFLTTNTPISAAPWLLKNVGYDPIKDFTPIGRIGNLPFVLIANNNMQASKVQDLVSMAKKNPGKVTYASGNATGILAGATFAKRAGIDMLHVPYKGSPNALTDLMGGRVDVMFNDLSSSLPYIQSGKIKAMAVASAKPSAIAPELESMEAAGINNFDLSAWMGFFGPANMDPAIVERLNTEINKIIANPEVYKKLSDMGFDAFGSTSQDFGQFVASQLDVWGGMIKEAGIEPQ
ncbi:MAG: tripartite tricarboxylate transporter substrate binding protein [Advenella sp.]